MGRGRQGAMGAGEPPPAAQGGCGTWWRLPSSSPSDAAGASSGALWVWHTAPDALGADDARCAQGGGFCRGRCARREPGGRWSGRPWAVTMRARECETSARRAAPDRRRQEARGALPESESGGREACRRRRGSCRYRGPSSGRGGGGGARHVEKLGRPEGGPCVLALFRVCSAATATPPPAPR